MLAQLGDHPLLQAHGELDTAYYLELARKVASGGPLAIAEPFFVSPLYVYALAAVFRLGGSIFAAQVLQILLGTAAVGLIFATTCRWFGIRPAWIAASLAVLTGIFTFYEILILQAALDPFLVALSLYLVSRASTESAARLPGRCRRSARSARAQPAECAGLWGNCRCRARSRRLDATGQLCAWIGSGPGAHLPP